MTRVFRHNKIKFLLMTSGILVGGGRGKGRCRQSDPVVSSVVDGVESLEKDLAKDELKSRNFNALNN